MDRGQRRTPSQPRTGQPQRPAQRSPQGSQQRRPAQSARPAQPTRPVNRKRKKNKSKKPWIIGAIVVLLLIIIFGSGGNENPDPVVTQNPTTAPVNDTPVTVTDTPTQAPTQKQSLFPQTIFNQNGVIITLTGFDKNTLMGPEIKFTVENNSGESLIVQTGSLHCNGWQVVDATSFIEVASGAKAGETIYVWSTYLDECQLKPSDLVNVEFKGASITTSDYMNTYEFDMTATLQ